MSQKRTNKVTVAFTDSEWKKIRRGARSSRESVGVFIREWALSGVEAAIGLEYTEAEERRQQIHLVS